MTRIFATLFFLFLISLSGYSQWCNTTNPTEVPRNLTVQELTPTSVRLEWEGGNGRRTYIFDESPGPLYMVVRNGDWTWSHGGQINSYGSTNQNSIVISGLTRGKYYKFYLLETNGVFGDCLRTLKKPEVKTSIRLSCNPGEPSRISSLYSTSFSVNSKTTYDRDNTIKASFNFETQSHETGVSGRHLIITRKNYAVNKTPLDGVTYAKGHNFGSNNFVDKFESLEPSTTYHWAMFDYRENFNSSYCGGENPNYLTSQVTRGSFITPCVTNEPTISAKNLVASNIKDNKITLTWTKGNGNKSIVVAKEGNDVPGILNDGRKYIANSKFSLGESIAHRRRVIYSGTGDSVTVTGLNPATQYIFYVLTFNENNNCYLKINYKNRGNDQSYKVSATTKCVSTVEPSILASNISFSNTTSSSMRINWKKGNGNNRIILAKKGIFVNKVPVDNNYYRASSTFGLGHNLGNESYVIYNGTGSYTYLYGLEPNTYYSFAVYEYNYDGNCIFSRNYMSFPTEEFNRTFSINGGDNLFLRSNTFSKNVSKLERSQLESLTISSQDPCLVKNIAYKQQSKQKGNQPESFTNTNIPNCELSLIYSKSKIIHIDFSSNLTAKSDIRIFDLNGRFVKHIDNTKNQDITVKIDFSYVSDNTLYLVRVTSEYEINTKRVILTR